MGSPLLWIFIVDVEGQFMIYIFFVNSPFKQSITNEAHNNIGIVVNLRNNVSNHLFSGRQLFLGKIFHVSFVF